MKHTILLLLLMALLVGCSSPTMGTKGTSDTVQGIIENRRTDDLRVLFRSEREISRMEKQQVCMVRSSSDKEEIYVKNGLLLPEVIMAYRGRPYDGQVKVISRDRIIQTSLFRYDPTEQASMIVLPGDLVFIQARQ